MRKNCLLFLILILNGKTISQTHEIAPSSFSVANASVADSKYYSAFKNPATAAFTQDITTGIQYENKFIIKQLSGKSIYAVIPGSLINVGVCGTYSGYELHNEFLAGISFSRNFTDAFQLGIQYNYYSVFLAGANKRFGSFFPQVGLLAKISPTVRIGFTTFNPGQQAIKLNLSKKQIPSVFSLGFDWKISENLNLLFQTDKNISGNYRFAGGVEYDIKNVLLFKTGAYKSDYLIPAIGFGTKIGGFSFHLNTELHPVLGLTTLAAVQYTFSKK